MRRSGRRLRQAQHQQQPLGRSRDDEEVGLRDLLKAICRKVRHDCECGVAARDMYFATVA